MANGQGRTPVTDLKDNRKERSERRVFALFHFVCILFLYLYCVSGLCLTPSSPHGLCRIFFCVFGSFVFLEFWKIGILDF